MKQILLVILLLASLIASAQTSPRIKYNFNSDWKVYVGDPVGADAASFDDSSWKKVTLPYAWNEDEAFKKDIVNLSTGIAWYRKQFKIPVTDSGKKVFIEFEGIRQAGDFYVNGKHVGMHENGITAFGFDVTDVVYIGDKENVIAARIDNDWNYIEKASSTKFQWEDKNFNANYGGISKNVFLHISNTVYQTLPLASHVGTTGVYIYGKDYSIKDNTATIHAESQVRNESDKTQLIKYEVVISDFKGKYIKTFAGDELALKANETKTVKAQARITGLHFWSWGYGYLYHVKTILKINNIPVDEVITTTGFRKTEFKDGMIYLNDRVIMIHGYAQRTSNEWPAIGLSVPAWLSDYSNKLMVESGGNLVRWMHITPWKQDIESCDRVGLMQAMPAGDAEKDVEGVRWEQRKAVMKDAIIYNRNNPSIIFYECGNESITDAHMQEMINIRNEYDPQGGRAIGSREMLESKVAEYGGEMLYTNKSAHIPMWAMEYSRDEGSRKYWDDYTPPYHKDGDGPKHKNQDASAYNRNMESHAVENVKRWFEFYNERPGTGKRVSAGGVNIVFSETNTHHRGEENYRRSGEVDGMRIKKQNFYSHEVMWNGWVNPEKEGIHIVGHWNYTPGIVKDIFVVSTADKVVLSVNEKPMGNGVKSDGFLFTFKNIAWQSGNIAAVGFNANGKEICSTRIITTGEPVALRLTSIEKPTEFSANGHDLSLVEVEVVDSKGNRCSTALNMVDFTLDGPAVWRGGMAMGPDNYVLAKTLPVENGVNRILIRSTSQAGTITISAMAEGLKPASLQLISHPFMVKNGLTTVLPSAGLVPNLDRGPTSLTSSYTITRTPLPVVSATAGANAENAFRSLDDNELSDWVNDGNLTTAWIEYELEKEAVVSEITLKLNNFRSRRYQLVVTVDGKPAFTGKTNTSLGYYTIHCTPQKGKQVRIKLTTPPQSEDNTMVEVSGKKLDDGVARDDSKSSGTLSIIEAEIYGPPK